MSRIVNQISIFAAFAALLTASLIAATQPASASARPVNEHVWLGTTAPDFTLHALDGTLHSLHGLRQNGYVLLVFWSTHCPFCQALIPDFKAIDERYKHKGLTLAAINIGYENAADVRAYATDHDLNYLILDDDARKSGLIKAYGIIGTPTIVLVSPRGIIRYYGHHLPDLSQYLKPSTPKGPHGSAATASTPPSGAH